MASPAGDVRLEPLADLIVTRPKIADLTIEQGDLDIERLPDGTVDLYETLRPVISEHPPIRLKITIEDGRLRFRDPVFTDPVVADKARVILDLGRQSEPITWDIKLAQNPGTIRRARRLGSSRKLQPGGGRSVGPARPDTRSQGIAVAVDAGQLDGPGSGRADGKVSMARCSRAACGSPVTQPSPTWSRWATCFRPTPFTSTP